MDGYLNRWFLDPLFGRGYPKDIVALYEPYFVRAGELERYDGKLDFLGANYYTRRVVRDSAEGPLRAERVEREDAERTAIGWEVHPASFRSLLLRLQRDYAPKDLYVTENGAAYDDTVIDDRVDDPARISFLSRHFGAAASALAAGVPLRGYFIWTLMDNFEWAHGTSKRFGIVHTDYRTQRRRVKASGDWYRRLIAAHREAQIAAAASK
jgi:beta-glucosidase